MLLNGKSCVIHSISIFFLLALLRIVEISSSESELDKNINSLFDWRVTDRKHGSGPCTLWWPLEGAEIFTFNLKEEKVVKLEVQFYCSDSTKVYFADFQLNNMNIRLSDFKPRLNLREIYTISIPNYAVSHRNNMSLIIYENQQIPGSSPIIANKFHFEIKFYDWQSREIQKLSKLDLNAKSMSIPAAHTLMLSRSREDFPFLLNALNLTNYAVEVGVNEALFSEIFLSAWKGKLYLMVDPWIAYAEEEYIDSANLPQQMQEVAYVSAKNRMSVFGDRAEFMRMTSLEASRLMADGILDFVYIDARHDYFDVMMDMMAWWPKLKRGGILAGHDFQMSLVRYAVLEFCRKMNLFLYGTHDDIPSWYLFKL